MSANATTSTRWDDLYRDDRHRLRYPSEHVVRWLAGLPSWEGKAIDIGCGTGRHVELLNDYGFQTVGIDVAASGACRGDMRDLSFASDVFDVALAYGVFYYGTMGDADQAVREMHRVLKPGGHGFVCVRSDRDWRTDRINGDGLFRLDGEPEDGMLLDFVNEDEIMEVYGVFSELSFEISEWTSHGRDRLNSDWLVQVIK